MRRFLATPLGGGAQALAVAAVLALVTYGSGGLSGLDRATVWLDLALFALSIALMLGYGGISALARPPSSAWAPTDTPGSQRTPWG